MNTKKRSGKNASTLMILTILTASCLLMGQTGCQTMGGGGGSITTSASQYGLDFALIPGTEMLSDGVKINSGDSFKVGVKVENYDTSPKSGQLCIKDNVGGSYGGIPDGTCQSFYVKEATYENGKLSASGSDLFYFPREDSDGYKFINYPMTLQSKLTVKATYIQNSEIQGPVTIPGPVTEETITLNQKPSLVGLEVKKSTAMRGQEYNAYLSMTLTKKLKNAQILNIDFKNKGAIFRASLGGHMLDCGLSSNVVEIDDTKLIKCSVLLPREESIYPLIVNLDYGAEISKDFTFTLQKEETIA